MIRTKKLGIIPDKATRVGFGSVCLIQKLMFWDIVFDMPWAQA